MLIPFFAGIFIIAILDQTAKLFAAGLLPSVRTIPIIEDIFHLTYVENTGAGFGAFSGYTWILTVLTLLVILAVVIYMVVKRPKNYTLLTALTFMMGGAVGKTGTLASEEVCGCGYVLAAGTYLTDYEGI